MRPPSTTSFPPASPAGRAMLVDFAALGGLFSVGVYLAYALTWTPAKGIPQDLTGLVVGRDFLNFWMYGRASATSEPGLWYDLAAYQRALADLLGPDRVSGPNWSYPPSVMLLAAPFRQLPYLPALALWTALGLAAFFLALRREHRSVRLAAILCPAATFCVISGQSSLLTAAAMIASFALMDRRPILAGVLIGCLTLKPQLGLLFPFMLAASGRWRVFAAAAGTALAIAAATTAAFGLEIWSDFVTKGLAVQNLVLSDPNRIATPFYPTAFMNLRGVGASYALAMTVQAALAAAAAGCVWWAFRRRRDEDPRLLAALFFAASIAATPYLLSYDTLTFAVSMLALVQAGSLDARGRLIAKLAFWLCPLQLLFGLSHIPGPALIAPAALLFLVFRLRRTSKSAEAVNPAPPAASPSSPAAS